MKTAVYSGSFNPLHEGHLAIIRRLSEMFDCCYVVVSPQSPFKGEENRDNASQRFETLCAVLASHPELNAKADDIELTMSAPQYTIRTLDALKAREPKNDFTLALGADCLPDFRKWREYERILLEYGIVVFPRTGHDAPTLISELLSENPQYKIKFVADAPLVNISSTEIRNGHEHPLP